jgi:hypothetical protein
MEHTGPVTTPVAQPAQVSASDVACEKALGPAKPGNRGTMIRVAARLIDQRADKAPDERHPHLHILESPQFAKALSFPGVRSHSCAFVDLGTAEQDILERLSLKAIFPDASSHARLILVIGGNNSAMLAICAPSFPVWGRTLSEIRDAGLTWAVWPEPLKLAEVMRMTLGEGCEIEPKCRVALNCEMGNPTKSTAELCP